MDRREHGGPGARHHAGRTAADGQPAAVPLGGPKAGGQRDVAAGTEQPGQGRVDQVQVTRVGQHDQRAPAGCRGRARGPRDLLRPVRPGQRGPDRARRAAAGQRAEERSARGVAGPRPRLRHRHWPGQRGGGRAGLLGPGVPGRDGQPQHVGQGARVAVGDLPGQGHDLRAEHRFRRDHPVQPGQAPAVRAGGHPVQQVPVDELAGEPDPDPAAGYRLAGQPFRDQVIERPVQVGQRDVDGHPGDRQLGRVGPGIPPGPARAARRTAVAAARGCPLAGCPCHGPVLPDPPDARPAPDRGPSSEPARSPGRTAPRPHGPPAARPPGAPGPRHLFTGWSGQNG